MTLKANLNKVTIKTKPDKCRSSPKLGIDTDSKHRINNKYQNVPARVDSSAPRYNSRILSRKLAKWSKNLREIYFENIQLLICIKKAHFARGKVDCRWEQKPKPSLQQYRDRVDSYKRIERENRRIYTLISTAGPRIPSYLALERDWRHNRRVMISTAQSKFVLFPPIAQETMEDPLFSAPPGVNRPRVYISLKLERGANLGELCVELFTESCPRTCKLFTDLLFGDGVGYGYVGTQMFRKVPHLYWSGGDVVFDNGFGCYAQRGRVVPIGAENYHYPHSMPGLLSMRVTRDDEMCGIFNITFKPLPQFDLKNVVFARVVRPSRTYSSITCLGSALSSQPAVVVSAARRRGARGQWRQALANTTPLTDQPPRCQRQRSPTPRRSLINHQGSHDSAR